MEIRKGDVELKTNTLVECLWAHSDDICLIPELKEKVIESDIETKYKTALLNILQDIDVSTVVYQTNSSGD